MALREMAARRYADAAFQIGRAEGTLDGWERDLERLRTALKDPTLRALAEHPAVTLNQKERVLRRVLPEVSDEPMRLVLLMLRRGRPRQIAVMLDRFGDLLRRHHGVALAEVTTALALDDAQRDQLSARIGLITDADIEIREKVDGALIGGLTVRIGDVLYDASVRSRLERLRARLTANQ